MVTNPLSAKARGIIYVCAIVIGAASIVVTAILAVVGMEVWTTVVAAIASASSILAASLARDNLTLDTQPGMGDLGHD